MATSDVGPSAAPRSWAEDLNTYRVSRGSCSYARLDQTSTPARYSRTNYVPFCDTRHKLYPYNDFVDGKGVVQVDDRIQNDRFARHGWGDTTLLKEEGFHGVPHPRGEDLTQHKGKAVPGSPRAPDGRNGLFGVLQMTEQGAPDSWLGNALINPAKGKAATSAPVDPKGRKDLFEVLQTLRSGAPADDSWLGHHLIDPAKGKGHAPGPEQIRGRPDLTEIFTQSILRDPGRVDLLKRGADPLADAWCGNRLIDPAKGKLPVPSPAAEEVMSGATFKQNGQQGCWSDARRRHTAAVAPPVADSAAQIITGQAQGDDWGRLSRRPGPNSTHGLRTSSAPSSSQGTSSTTTAQQQQGAGCRITPVDMYAAMTYRPLSETERSHFSKALDDGRITGRRLLATPGSMDPAKGPDMLQWRPDYRVACFVPHGGIAQENRFPKGTSRAPPGGGRGSGGGTRRSASVGRGGRGFGGAGGTH